MGDGGTWGGWGMGVCEGGYVMGGTWGDGGTWWGVRGGMGVRERGTSWVVWGVRMAGVRWGGRVDTLGGGGRYIGWGGGEYVGCGGTLGRGGGGGGGWREELVKNAVFGHFLENYYILAAPRWTCSFKFCIKLQKLESLFTKFNQISWILCTKNNPLYWKQKWIIIDYNGL